MPAAFCSRRCPMRPLTRACFSCPCVTGMPLLCRIGPNPHKPLGHQPWQWRRAHRTSCELRSYFRHICADNHEAACTFFARTDAACACLDFTWNQRRSRQPCDDEQSEPGEVSRTPDTGGLQAGSSELRLPRLLYTTTPATHRAVPVVPAAAGLAATCGSHGPRHCDCRRRHADP